MKVTCIKCPQCKDTIYSRTTHDYRPCSCGTVAIDGGSEYIRVLWKQDVCSIPKPFKKNVKHTKKQLYDDWNHRKDKLGLIKKS